MKISPRYEDLTDCRFGKVTVMEYVGDCKWKCRCDCGAVFQANGSKLKRGMKKSCGCSTRELIGNAHRTHGQKKTRLYHIWQGMKQRCFWPKSPIYKYYGGRGITVCDEWKNDFLSFAEWSKISGYSDSLTLDRIDTDGNYEPNNCRWSTYKEQERNKRNNRLIEFRGETKTMTDWCETFGFRTDTVWRRLKRGWSIEEALTKPLDESMRRIR